VSPKVDDHVFTPLTENRVPLTEICRSFASNTSLENGTASAELGPTIVWDCVLVLVSIFVATLPAVTKVIERGFECFQRHPAPNLKPIFAATLPKITKMIVRVFEYFQPHQVPDLEMQKLTRYGGSQQPSTAALMSLAPSNDSLPLHSPTLKWPERAYQEGGNYLAKSSGGEVSSRDQEIKPFYHAR
jgi:hypothetical protein